MLDMVNRGHQNPGGENTRKAFKWILIDSIIIGAFACAASMPEGWPSFAQLWVMFRAFALSFTAQLIYERGIKKGPSGNKS